MVCVSFGSLRITPEWSASIWDDSWLLFVGTVARSNNAPLWAVTALNSDGRRQQAYVPGLDRSPEVCAYRVLNADGTSRPPDVSGVPRVAFGPKRHSQIVCGVLTNPLSVSRIPIRDHRLQYHFADHKAGDVIADVAAHYKQYGPNDWCPNATRKALDAEFEHAGKTGIVVFNRETAAIRTFDTGAPVTRVEVRPDGLVVAAIQESGVVFFDLDF